MNHKEIRWKQRFQNFEKSFQLLAKTVAIESLSEIERGGLIQFFEVTFELSWKTMKDYLESQGFIVNSPRDAIKQAFQSELITEGHVWLEALEDRNLTTHTYDEATSLKIERLIKQKYFPVMKAFYHKLKSES
ncbi:nucleotidyltransferase substrate binding protein [candidate division KSB1 bacterium]|nr:nucleotidyltransferase substrate binding protein [candidate division KSB1 bacterium]